MLEFVSFANLNGITGTLPASWGTTWSNIYAIDLWGTPYLQGTLPPEWSGMTNLHFLRIMGNQLTSTIPTEFGRLTQLRDLSLHNSHLSGGIPQEICALRTSFSLEKLSVDCKEGSVGSIQCSDSDCCTFCSTSLEGYSWDDDDGR